ncbi:hypothetical protein T265_12262 [Opisthorchis viverrini]|uniref:Uncharacterized protein n=1 Tax=Opisthorchis viverrini TaxID=6198 RepID=A0A074YZ40_OPIVI|nr:hypothetical protein T265_12262 [Opisthorchis viverrini]KER18477.1 hypothetical protein T265_12262 [Opisthorchis viverrini]
MDNRLKEPNNSLVNSDAELSDQRSPNPGLGGGRCFSNVIFTGYMKSTRGMTGLVGVFCTRTGFTEFYRYWLTVHRRLDRINTKWAVDTSIAMSDRTVHSSNDCSHCSLETRHTIIETSSNSTAFSKLTRLRSHPSCVELVK